MRFASENQGHKTTRAFVRQTLLPRASQSWLGAPVALALLAGGGTSNLLDRLLYDGRVTDFLNVGIGSLRTGIFNLADMAIMAGALLLVLKKRASAAGPSPPSSTAPPRP